VRPSLAAAAAVATIALVAAARFHRSLLAPAPLADEQVYLDGFRAYAAGRSPYGPSPTGRGFYYPPTFARGGAAALELVAAPAIVGTLRAANLLGLAVTLWIAARRAPLSPRASATAGALYVLAAPPALVHGFTSGNLSFAVVGGILVALSGWLRRPWSSGALLGASLLVKPLAPVAAVALVAHRPATATRRHFAAVAAAALVAISVSASTRLLADYLAAGAVPVPWPLPRAISLHRWLAIAGIPLSPLAVTAFVAAGTAIWARRRPLAPRGLLVVALAGTTLATTVLWSHSLLLTLPLQAMALGVALRRRAGGAEALPVRGAELALVALAALALQFADGIGGGVELAPAAVQLPVLAVPVFAPLALALYLRRHDDEAPGTGDRSRDA
jgi:hypothetical protein